MKLSNAIALHVTNVISEPGDCTRYEYYVHQVGDEYYFMKHENCTDSMHYPRQLNFYQHHTLLDDDAALFKLANAEGCNYSTLAECVRQMISMNEDRKYRAEVEPLSDDEVDDEN